MHSSAWTLFLETRVKSQHHPGEENNNDDTDDKNEGVEDNKVDYNTMVTIVTTITTTLLLPCMSYYVGSDGGQPYLSINK